VASIAFKVNLPVALASTLVTNPFTYAPIYWAAWRVGSTILAEDATTSPFDEPLDDATVAASPPVLSGAWIASLPSRLSAVGRPLVVGLLVFALGFSALCYLAVNAFWILFVRGKRRRRLAAAGAVKAARAAPVG
jgi:uncharacterized protein (DUF2062 family)